jgi:cell division protein FtsB
MMSVGPKRYLWKRMAASHVTIAVLAVVVFFLGNATWNVYKRYATTHEKEMLAKESLQAKAARAIELEEEIERLKSEKGKEEEIRTRYGMAKEGERMIVVVDEEDEDDGIIPFQTLWYERLWNWVTGK